MMNEKGPTIYDKTEFYEKEIQPRVDEIKSNHADANVENYEYDYIIENDGTLEQLDKMAYLFSEQVIKNNCFEKPVIFKCSDLVGEI